MMNNVNEDLNFLKIIEYTPHGNGTYLEKLGQYYDGLAPAWVRSSPG